MPYLNTEPTYTATIYVGTFDKRANNGPIPDHALVKARSVCQNYVDSVGLCVTITPTEFVYTNGREHGFAIGLINYPRFPVPPVVIQGHAMALAERLQKAFGQHRVCIVFPDKTVMFTSEEDDFYHETPEYEEENEQDANEGVSN